MRILCDRPRDAIAPGRRRGLIGRLGLLATLALGVATAAAVDAPPPAPVETLNPGAAPTSPVAAPATTASGVLGSRELRMGMRGGDVRQLQRLLRTRGFPVSPDGAFGGRTRAAVRSLQRRLKLRQSGVADRALFTRLGIKLRGELSGATPVTTAPKADYPLAGPNAAGAKYLKAFPVAGKHTYTNDFGAPRPQGTHEGNDIMAARNVPVRAVVAGTVKQLSRVETFRGGITIWLRDAAGNTFFYAHLDHIVPGLDAGSAVALGQVLGGVGNTGDARYGATHLHFEIHPGGGAAWNPYTDLLAVDPEPAAH